MLFATVVDKLVMRGGHHSKLGTCDGAGHHQRSFVYDPSGSPPLGILIARCHLVECLERVDLAYRVPLELVRFKELVCLGIDRETECTRLVGQLARMVSAPVLLPRQVIVPLAVEEFPSLAKRLHLLSACSGVARRVERLENQPPAPLVSELRCVLFR